MSSHFGSNQQPGYNQPPAQAPHSGQPSAIHPSGYQSYYPQQPQGGQYYPQPQSGYFPQSSYGYGYTPQQNYMTPAQPNSQFNPPPPGYTAPPAPHSNPAAFGASSPHYANQPTPLYPSQGYQSYYPPQSQGSQYYNPASSQPQSGYSPQSSYGYTPQQSYMTPAQPNSQFNPPPPGYTAPPAPHSSPAPFGVPSPQQGYFNQPTPPPASPSAPSPSKSVAMAPPPKDSEILQGRDLSLKTIVFGKGSPALFSPPRVTEAKIPNRLIEKKDYQPYWQYEPGAGEILYHLDKEKYKVSYKYRDVVGEIKSGEIALGDVDSRYKDTLPKRSLESAGSASQWSRDFNQKLNETISKQIQKKYTDNLKLIKFNNAGSYNATSPYEGEVLYCAIGNEIHCKYWVLEDLSLSLVNKQYTTEAFFANKGDRSIQDRISDQVKLIFDLAEYLRTIKQEISNTLGTPTQRAKRSVAQKLVAYLKDRANAAIPTFTEEEISVIYKGVFSHRLGDLVDRAKAIYELDEVLKSAPSASIN